MSPLSPVNYVPLDAGTATEAEEVSVSTVAATAVATGHLMLKLEGYSWLKAMHGENGSYIESSVFEVGGHTWTIRCYLNGNSKKDAGFVSLFRLHLCSDSVVLAEYELALCGWGCSRFISVKKLERSRFLEDDCFAVRCTVTVVQERTVKEKVVLQAHDMARLGLGMLCKCADDLCKRHHARPAETFLERLANFCYSICRGPV
ncbi:BTB/POZ and MATH domain-containing protein 3-like [Miscanthus floridulus]|uniref:BTB/POZ and MATH domain-containing protein 3-like n=1 Tax=Miscanthus floridulus TaxID=154761 RepID=UPI0034599AFB